MVTNKLYFHEVITLKSGSSEALTDVTPPQIMDVSMNLPGTIPQTLTTGA